MADAFAEVLGLIALGGRDGQKGETGGLEDSIDKGITLATVRTLMTGIVELDGEEGLESMTWPRFMLSS